MTNSFFTSEMYPFMYKDFEIGKFIVDLNENGTYIFSIDIDRTVPKKYIPLNLKGISNDDFISINSDEELHIELVRAWIEERVFPPEKANTEELINILDMSKYDQLVILKYTGGKNISDPFWIKFSPNDSFI